MFFAIFVALMVILITAFWVYQGFFSSMIMFLETLLACIITFAFYENINSLWKDSLDPGIGLPLAFMGLFLLVLLGLRVATDKMIPTNVNFPMYVDRAGGGICGFFTGMILVGTALIGLQMLPIGSAIFFFERYTTNKEGYPEESNLSFLKPDRFTAGMMNMLSNQARFGGQNPLNQAKPDLIDELYSARAGVQSEQRMFLPSDVLKVEAYWEVTEIDHVQHSLDGETLVRNFETSEPEKPGNKFLVCRVRIDEKAAKKDKLEIRFRVPQFRIVGPPPDSKGQFSKQPGVWLAVGMSDLFVHKHYGPNKVSPKQAQRLVRFGPQSNFILGPAETESVATRNRKGYSFDVAFEVPIDFEPWYIAFKYGASVDLTKLTKEEEPPDWASTALGDKGPSGRIDRDDKVGRAPGGRTHLANAIDDRTEASAKLPVSLPRTDPIVQRYSRGDRLSGGHFHLRLPPEDELDSATPVSEFAIPRGRRMVQVGAEVLKAESMYGKALSFANRVTAQIRIRDESGKDYFAIGQYGAAEIGGVPYFEVQYFPDAEIPERCLKKPNKVTRKAIDKAGRENSKYGFLFLVDPGVKIVSFHAANKQQPLNIQVPN